MIPLVFIFVILIAHYIGDFVLQTHWMASNKSKSMLALSAHALTYTLTIGLFVGIAGFAFGYSAGEVFAWTLFNGVIHMIVDYITSRWSSKFWQKQDYHSFFMVVGFDQAIHYACLFASSMPLLLSVTAL